GDDFIPARRRVVEFPEGVTMRICRFLLNSQSFHGVVEDRAEEPWIVRLTAAPWLHSTSRPEPEQSSFSAPSFAPMPLRAAHLLAPVSPTKIVCIGRNYRDHVKELGHDLPAEPLFFLKPPSALLRPGGVVRMPGISARVDYEGELALVIGRSIRKLREEDWRSAVSGYTLANDVTARDLQNRDSQWTRAKGFDTFCPVGPIVSDEVDPETGLTVETRVNGELRQHGSTLDFIFPIPRLLAHITSVMTLEPGDLVLTGTPAGVGPLAAGDHVEVSIPGLGVLANTFQPDEN
ncbi:MAG: fumarylacetoacetate hydrolase family protein, partial [Terracidiphilus sp.]